jgi:hypothetical protein
VLSSFQENRVGLTLVGRERFIQLCGNCFPAASAYDREAIRSTGWTMRRLALAQPDRSWYSGPWWSGIPLLGLVGWFLDSCRPAEMDALKWLLFLIAVLIVSIVPTMIVRGFFRSRRRRCPLDNPP